MSHPERLVHSRITARAARVSTHPITMSTRSSGSLRAKCSGTASHPKFQNKFSRLTSTTLFKFPTSQRLTVAARSWWEKLRPRP